MSSSNNKSRSIGRYPLRKKIGMGAMGSVYLAHDDMIDRPVAIKAIRISKDKTPEERKRAAQNFFEEARMVGKLNHPHITAIYDMGIHGRTPYIVMELVTGRTLATIIKRRLSLPIREVVSQMAMICQAIHYVHRHGILHRDLKPSNIMINMNQLTPKIMDFGVAKPTKSPHKDFADWAVENESLVGTPYYMSPEQILGREMTPRSDLFSLGVVFYEWLSGVRPFQGDSMVNILKGIVENQPIFLSDTADVDSDLSDIIHRALRKRASERFASAAEMADAFVLYREKLDQAEVSEDSDLLDVTMGARQNIAEFRKQYEFFFDFTDKELFEIFQISSPETYEPGQVIIHEARTGRRMYFIIEGAVQVLKRMGGKSVVLKDLVAGESFGEMSFIDDSPRTASVVSTQRTHVMALNETVLRQTNPILCLKLLRALAGTISDRLRATDQKYLALLEGITKLTRESGYILD